MNWLKLRRNLNLIICFANQLCKFLHQNPNFIPHKVYFLLKIVRAKLPGPWDLYILRIIRDLQIWENKKSKIYKKRVSVGFNHSGGRSWTVPSPWKLQKCSRTFHSLGGSFRFFIFLNCSVKVDKMKITKESRRVP